MSDKDSKSGIWSFRTYCAQFAQSHVFFIGEVSDRVSIFVPALVGLASFNLCELPSYEIHVAFFFLLQSNLDMSPGVEKSRGAISRFDCFSPMVFLLDNLWWFHYGWLWFDFSPLSLNCWDVYSVLFLSENSQSCCFVGYPGEYALKFEGSNHHNKSRTWIG